MKRLVDDAVVLKKLVVVALVPVAFLKVKCWRVVEPTTKRSPEVLIVVEAEPPTDRVLASSVEEKSEVDVAWVEVERVMELKI